MKLLPSLITLPARPAASATPAAPAALAALATLLVLLSLLAPSQARAEPPPPELSAAVRNYTLNRVGDDKPHFKHALVDLNDDQIKDAIVLLTDALWCGTGGCRMLVFKGSGTAFSYHSSSTVVREPVRVMPDKLHGWHTLIVNTKGVGDVLMIHGSKTYPANPSLQKAASPGQLSTAKTLIY